jgi:hypothetical protein
VPLFRNRQDKSVDPEARSPKLGVKYKDLMVMNQLVEHGADLAQPREVIFYSYASSRDVADQMASDATDEGFGAEVREPLPQYPGQWSVICKTHATVDPPFVRSTVDFFEGLAARHGSEYDGWEAAV